MGASHGDKVTRAADGAAEIELFRFGTGGFETQFDCLTNAVHQHVQRFGLGIATLKAWNGSDVVAFAVTFDDDVELAAHVAGPCGILNIQKFVSADRPAEGR
jgi:hypothetical protein